MPLTQAQIDKISADEATIANDRAREQADLAVLAADVAALVPDDPIPDMPPADVTAPDTMLVSGPPSGPDATAIITFSGTDDQPGAVTFEGSLDGAAFSAVTSPVALSGLSVGAHSYQIRAKDAAGNVDATPAVANWTVTAPPPPPPPAMATWRKLTATYAAGDVRAGPALGQGWWKSVMNRLTGDIFIAEGQPNPQPAPPAPKIAVGGTFFFRAATNAFERLNEVVGDWHMNVGNRENYGADFDHDRNLIYLSPGGPVGFVPTGGTQNDSPQYGDMVYDIAAGVFRTTYKASTCDYVPLPADAGFFQTGAGGGSSLGGFDSVLIYDADTVYRFGNYSVGAAQNMSKRNVVTGAISAMDVYTAMPPWTSQPSRSTTHLRSGMDRRNRKFYAFADGFELWMRDFAGSWTRVPTTGDKPTSPSPYTGAASAPDFGIIAVLDETANKIIAWCGSARTVVADPGVSVRKTWALDLATMVWSDGPSAANGDVVPPAECAVVQNLHYDPIGGRVLLLIWDGAAAAVWELRGWL